MEYMYIVYISFPTTPHHNTQIIWEDPKVGNNDPCLDINQTKFKWT